MEDDYLLDEDEDDVYLNPEEEEPEDDEEESEGEEEEDLSKDDSLYEGKIGKEELWMIRAYDDIVKCKDIEEAASIIVYANPQHTSTSTVSFILKDLLHKQGHARMQATYAPGPLRGAEVSGILGEGDDDLDIELNNEIMEELRSLVNGFVDYLVHRDLSGEGVTKRRRLNRYLAAFLIFMFSSGLYDFVINCPSMPPEYQEQINFALKKINQDKEAVLQKLIDAYRKAGRPKVAQRVEEEGMSWFLREPAEVRIRAEYKDLNLTAEDIDIYKKIRPEYVNLTTALTQDVISDYIEVVLDKKKGLYEKLKDKTRFDAINDVKKEFKEWAEENRPDKPNLADKLLFKNL